MMTLKQSTATTITVLLASAGVSVPGLASSEVLVYYSKAGGVPQTLTLSSGNFNELSSTDMPGLYSVTVPSTVTDTLGELVLSVRSSLGTFDQYNVSARIYANTDDDLAGQVSIQSTSILNAISSVSTELTGIKGSGFSSASDSLKVVSDRTGSINTSLGVNLTGPVALSSQLTGSGGTVNAPAGVGLWDVLGDGSVSLATLGNQLSRALGLLHENFAFVNQTYDANNNMVGAKIRLYATQADVLADATPTQEYTVNAVYNGNAQLISYTMVLDP